MAKEIAIGKRAKITKAQQNMILSVGLASIILGVSTALTIRFIKQITFNSDVIATEEQSIASYSDAIKSIGVCKSPKGSIYTEDELRTCDPNNIQVSEVPNTLRSNVLEKLAANEALNSVPKEASSICIDPTSGKNYTYKALEDKLKRADNATELAEANQLMKSCSALRIIPDALPSFKNEEALLASLNKLFIDADWQPESLSPAGAVPSGLILPEGVNALPVNLSIEANAATTVRVLSNIERSIREFDISTASIEWKSGNTLSLQAPATAYYVDKATLAETDIVIKGDQ